MKKTNHKNNDIEIIWEKFHDKLLSFIKKRVNESSDAEDILHNIFLKIYLKIDSLKEQKKIKSWIYQIARNVIIDHYRTRSILAELPDWLTEKESEDSIETKEELYECLKAMISFLPEKYSRAIQFSDIDGKPQKELSRIESISLSGAKSRIQRGRILLKNMLFDCCQFELDDSNQIVKCKSDKKCKYC